MAGFVCYAVGFNFNIFFNTVRFTIQVTREVLV